jgi:hypothetical protein
LVSIFYEKLPTTGTGFMPVWVFEKLALANFLLPNKDMLFRTFSKAHALLVCIGFEK